MAYVTANGKYFYDEVFYGRTLEEWVQGANAALGNASGWVPKPLTPGAFGFDNLANSIGLLFEDKLTISLEEAAKVVHIGWCMNYMYWRDCQPFMESEDYKRPYNALGDERRDALAKTLYGHLDEDEKQKDRIVAKYVLDEVAKWEDAQVSDDEY